MMTCGQDRGVWLVMQWGKSHRRCLWGALGGTRIVLCSDDLEFMAMSTCKPRPPSPAGVSLSPSLLPCNVLLKLEPAIVVGDALVEVDLGLGPVVLAVLELRNQDGALEAVVCGCNVPAGLAPSEDTVHVAENRGQIDLGILPVAFGVGARGIQHIALETHVLRGFPERHLWKIVVVSREGRSLLIDVEECGFIVSRYCLDELGMLGYEGSEKQRRTRWESEYLYLFSAVSV